MDAPSPLLDVLDEIGAAVASARHLAIFLDFDGTLAPIVERPSLAQLPVETRTILELLARRPDCTVGIISGRSLEDIRERVGIDGLVHAGNHGLEIDGRGVRFDVKAAGRIRQETASAVVELGERLAHVPGVEVESKGLTASVHDRRVPFRHRGEIERIVRRAVPEEHPHLYVSRGEMVWEIRPRIDWNKGSAIRWIRERLGLERALAFYIGDDRTDEDAFAEIGRFITARVGPARATLAGYRIGDTREVAEFLSWLRHVRRFEDTHQAD